MRSGSRPCRGAGRPGAAPEAVPGAPAPASPATGSVKVKRAPRPTPPLSARMRPPWASTRPLQMARPRPDPRVPVPRSPTAAPEYLRNSCARRSGAMPLPSSATETATCTPSRSAATRIGEDSGACRAAFASRLFSTCSTRWRSAMTRGRSGGRSIVTVCGARRRRGRWCAPGRPAPPPPRARARPRACRCRCARRRAGRRSARSCGRPGRRRCG